MKGKFIKKLLTGVLSAAMFFSVMPSPTAYAIEVEAEEENLPAEPGNQEEGAIYPFDAPLLQNLQEDRSPYWTQKSSKEYNANGTFVSGWDSVFDKNGRSIKQIFYDDGKISSIETCEYDTEGYMMTTSDADGNVTRIDKSEYRDGVIIREDHINFVDDNIYATFSYVYEYKDGNLTKATGYDKNGNVFGTYYYEHDSNGRETGYKFYDLDNVYTIYGVNEYDEKGNRIKFGEYNLDGSLISRYENTFNDQGFPVSYMEYGSDNKVRYGWANEYDDSGRITKYTYISGDKTQITVYEYDDTTMNMSKMTYYDGDMNKIGSGVKEYYTEGPKRWLTKKITEYDKDNNMVSWEEYDWQYITFGYIPEDAKSEVPEGYDMLFRLYNPNTGEHFYTTSRREGNSLVDQGWEYEGPGWIAPVSGDPVYRLYNENAGDHHYTMSKRERDKLVELGWTYERIGWYSEPKKTGKPLYRLYNPNATGAGSHHYTTSEKEKKSLIAIGWKDEDVAWYGLAQ